MATTAREGEGECSGDATEPPAGAEAAAPLSAAQRARIERNRQRARALHQARLAHKPLERVDKPARVALDSGGGFLLRPEEEAAAPRRASPPPAPRHAHERPACEECGRRFAGSHLLAAFDLAVCDECRDDEGAHALVTRTEAKAEFLLKDCDLDARPPPLRSERRPNPHRGAHADMRLYLRAQVAARAEEVWGGPEGLAEERERREERRLATRQRASGRKLRALRLAVRSSVYAQADAAHRHRWGEERHDSDADEYRRVCLDCGHEQTYEKM